jgi:cobalt/nickel transport system permease protein
MHIPDGFLSTPVWVAMDAITIGVIAVAVKKAKQEINEEKIPLLGTLAAFVFAAQMLNFPVLAGTSGHLLGGFLIARLIGPWASILAMTAIFVVQSLIFQDGGVLALGANIFNMGVVGCLLSYSIYWALSKIKSSSTDSIAIFIAAWSSVFIAALFVTVQLSLSGTVPLKESFIAMGSVHALIGVFEAIITLAVVRFVEKLIPSTKLREA